MNPHELSTAVKEIAAGLGHELCGICPATRFPRLENALAQRCRSFPASTALYRDLERHIDPMAAAPWARSVIVTARNYGRFRIPAALRGHFGKYYLVETGLPYRQNDRQALVFQERLAKLGIRAERRELASRAAAEQAGIGRCARNNFLQTAFGSWVAIETWLADAVFAYDTPLEGSPCIPGCRRCVDACPTKALQGPHSMDFGRCITHCITSDDPPVPGGPDPACSPAMEGWLYGCDRCQDACPLNRGKWREEAEFPGLAEFAADFSLERVEAGDPGLFATLFAKFGFIRPDQGWKWRAGARRALANRGGAR
jgi:epoxyqueuosine reductase